MPVTRGDERCHTQSGEIAGRSIFVTEKSAAHQKSQKDHDESFKARAELEQIKIEGQACHGLERSQIIHLETFAPAVVREKDGSLSLVNFYRVEQLFDMIACHFHRI